MSAALRRGRALLYNILSTRQSLLRSPASIECSDAGVSLHRGTTDRQLTQAQPLLVLLGHDFRSCASVHYAVKPHDIRLTAAPQHCSSSQNVVCHSYRNGLGLLRCALSGHRDWASKLRCTAQTGRSCRFAVLRAALPAPHTLALCFPREPGQAGNEGTSHHPPVMQAPERAQPESSRPHSGGDSGELQPGSGAWACRGRVHP